MKYAALLLGVVMVGGCEDRELRIVIKPEAMCPTEACSVAKTVAFHDGKVSAFYGYSVEDKSVGWHDLMGKPLSVERTTPVGVRP